MLDVYKLIHQHVEQRDKSFKAMVHPLQVFLGNVELKLRDALPTLDIIYNKRSKISIAFHVASMPERSISEKEFELAFNLIENVTLKEGNCSVCPPSLLFHLTDVSSKKLLKELGDVDKTLRQRLAGRNLHIEHAMKQLVVVLRPLNIPVTPGTPHSTSSLDGPLYMRVQLSDHQLFDMDCTAMIHFFLGDIQRQWSNDMQHKATTLKKSYIDFTNRTSNFVELMKEDEFDGFMLEMGLKLMPEDSTHVFHYFDINPNPNQHLVQRPGNGQIRRPITGANMNQSSSPLIAGRFQRGAPQPYLTKVGQYHQHGQGEMLTPASISTPFPSNGFLTGRTPLDVANINSPQSQRGPFNAATNATNNATAISEELRGGMTLAPLRLDDVVDDGDDETFICPMKKVVNGDAHKPYRISVADDGCVFVTAPAAFLEQFSAAREIAPLRQPSIAYDDDQMHVYDITVPVQHAPIPSMEDVDMTNEQEQKPYEDENRNQYIEQEQKNFDSGDQLLNPVFHQEQPFCQQTNVVGNDGFQTPPRMDVFSQQAQQPLYYQQDMTPIKMVIVGMTTTCGFGDDQQQQRLLTPVKPTLVWATQGEQKQQRPLVTEIRLPSPSTLARATEEILGSGDIVDDDDLFGYLTPTSSSTSVTCTNVVIAPSVGVDDALPMIVAVGGGGDDIWLGSAAMPHLSQEIHCWPVDVEEEAKPKEEKKLKKVPAKKPKLEKVAKTLEVISLEDEDDEQPQSSNANAKNGDDKTHSESGENDAEDAMSSSFDEWVDENEVLLVFPPTKPIEKITIHMRELRALACGELLNDAIIEFGLLYIKHYVLTAKLRKEIHFYNSFLISTFATNFPTLSLCRNTNRRSSQTTRKKFEANYNRIKNWTKKVDVFSKEYLVIPINDDCHWLVVIVVNPAGAVISDEEEANEDFDVNTFIVYFDSLPDFSNKRMKHMQFLVETYLELEYENKHGSANPTMHFSRRRVQTFRPLNIPMQRNFIDCGIFVLYFVEAFFNEHRCLPPLKEMFNFDWAQHFIGANEVHKFMRDKTFHRIMTFTEPKQRSRLEQFERRMKAGPTLEGDRKHRRHSAPARTSVVTPHPSTFKRCYSLTGLETFENMDPFHYSTLPITMRCRELSETIQNFHI